MSQQKIIDSLLEENRELTQKLHHMTKCAVAGMVSTLNVLERHNGVGSGFLMADILYPELDLEPESIPDHVKERVKRYSEGICKINGSDESLSLVDVVKTLDITEAVDIESTAGLH